MIEAIRHALGLCGDNHMHLDLTDLFLVGGSVGYFLYYAKIYAKVAVLMIKDYIWNQ